MDTLAQDIVQHAYTLDPRGLDAAMEALGLPSWPYTVQNLSFQGWDTGGGCMMLVADLPDTVGHQVGITNGDAEFPQNAENFWVGVMDPDGEELYFMFVTGGLRQAQH